MNNYIEKAKKGKKIECEGDFDDKIHAKTRYKCPECGGEYCLKCARYFDYTCFSCQPPMLEKKEPLIN